MLRKQYNDHIYTYIYICGQYGGFKREKNDLIDGKLLASQLADQSLEDYLGEIHGANVGGGTEEDTIGDNPVHGFGRMEWVPEDI